MGTSAATTAQDHPPPDYPVVHDDPKAAAEIEAALLKAGLRAGIMKTPEEFFACLKDNPTCLPVLDYDLSLPGAFQDAGYATCVLLIKAAHKAGLTQLQRIALVTVNTKRKELLAICGTGVEPVLVRNWDSNAQQRPGLITAIKTEWLLDPRRSAKCLNWLEPQFRRRLSESLLSLCRCWYSWKRDEVSDLAWRLIVVKWDAGRDDLPRIYDSLKALSKAHGCEFNLSWEVDEPDERDPITWLTVPPQSGSGAQPLGPRIHFAPGLSRLLVEGTYAFDQGHNLRDVVEFFRDNAKRGNSAPCAVMVPVPRAARLHQDLVPLLRAGAEEIDLGHPATSLVLQWMQDASAQNHVTLLDCLLELGMARDATERERLLTDIASEVAPGPSAFVGIWRGVASLAGREQIMLTTWVKELKLAAGLELDQGGSDPKDAARQGGDSDDRESDEGVDRYTDLKARLRSEARRVAAWVLACMGRPRSHAVQEDWAGMTLADLVRCLRLNSRKGEKHVRLSVFTKPDEELEMAFQAGAPGARAWIELLAEEICYWPGGDTRPPYNELAGKLVAAVRKSDQTYDKTLGSITITKKRLERFSSNRQSALIDMVRERLQHWCKGTKPLNNSRRSGPS